MNKVSKRVSFIVFILFLTMFLLSCRENSVDEDILRNLLEMEYISNNITGMEGIFSPLFSSINNNRFYFRVRRLYETDYISRGIGIYSYIDLTTGEHRLICPDPLCTHTFECKYTGFEWRMFFAEKNIFYTESISRFRGGAGTRASIYRIDLNNGRIDVIYQAEHDYTIQNITIGGIYNNKLYFFIGTLIEIEGEREMAGIRTLKTIDLNTHEISEMGNFPDKYVNSWSSIMFIYGNTFYFRSLSNIFSTDFNFENEKIIYTFQPNEFVRDYFFDTNTNELFFLVHNMVDHTGTIYVHTIGETKELSMPHDNIAAFQLMNDRIYYSPFDVLFLGNSMWNNRMYNYTGDIIYVTDRNSRIKSDLIFDGEGRYNIVNAIGRYIIIGDYVHFHYMQFMDDGTHVWFDASRDLSKVRINLKDSNAIRHHLRFE